MFLSVFNLIVHQKRSVLVKMILHGSIQVNTDSWLLDTIFAQSSFSCMYLETKLRTTPLQCRRAATTFLFFKELPLGPYHSSRTLYKLSQAIVLPFFKSKQYISSVLGRSCNAFQPLFDCSLGCLKQID